MFDVPANTVPSTTALDALVSHPVRVALAVAADRDRWRSKLRYDPEERYATLVERTADQEVWLMAWLPGQTTGLHDHSDTTGAFTVVSGTLAEQVAHRGHPRQALHTLVAGQSRVFAPGYVHTVHNPGPDPAISIHVYRSSRPVLGRYRLDPVTGPEPL
ncbi:cysteine dioxygenase [Actinokineospora pegani]|uniref:cysteine dioxygenase n=1 Tax=Actinokineospora pegani TaxID=2654637 RepID=UPI0012EA3063|nr:cysteine dioxygenase family protein [Actinokineospora pegani]